MNPIDRLSRTCVLPLALAALLIFAWTGVASAGALAIRVTAEQNGSDIEGYVSIINRSREALQVESIATWLEMKLLPGVPLAALEPGSQKGYWKLADVEIALPAAIPARQVVWIPYRVSLCAAGDVSIAKSIRIAALASGGGSSAKTKSRKLAAPADLECAVCGNGDVEGEEECDGGSCCSSECEVLANGTSCSDANACTGGDVCTAGVCGGSAVSCNDGDVCSADSCDAELGCVHAPIPGCSLCDAASCESCKSTCPNQGAEACQNGCWASFYACLSGCTTTYCAPFCQVDLGRCLGFCPDGACFDACEAANGCAPGCTEP